MRNYAVHRPDQSFWWNESRAAAGRDALRRVRRLLPAAVRAQRSSPGFVSRL